MTRRPPTRCMPVPSPSTRRTRCIGTERGRGKRSQLSWYSSAWDQSKQFKWTRTVSLEERRLRYARRRSAEREPRTRTRNSERRTQNCSGRRLLQSALVFHDSPEQRLRDFLAIALRLEQRGLVLVAQERHLNKGAWHRRADQHHERCLFDAQVPGRLVGPAQAALHRGVPHAG